MLLSEANLYAAPVLVLVTGILGGWLLRCRCGGRMASAEGAVSQRRSSDSRPAERGSAVLPTRSNVDRATDACSEIESKNAPCVRNTFLLALDCHLPESARRGEPFSVLLVSVDNDRGLGDRHGLRVDKELLEAAGKLFISSVRSTDWVARFEATTFAFLLPGAIHAQALMVAERLRRNISRAALPAGPSPARLTLSIGATDIAPGDSSASIVQRAEEALSAATRDGGDCIRSQLGNRTGTSVGIATKYVCAIT